MTRAARKVIPFRPRKPRVIVSAHYDYDPAHHSFARQHTGDAPEPLAVRLSWLQIIARISIGAALLAAYIMVSR